MRLVLKRKAATLIRFPPDRNLAPWISSSQVPPTTHSKSQHRPLATAAQESRNKPHCISQLSHRSIPKGNVFLARLCNEHDQHLNRSRSALAVRENHLPCELIPGFRRTQTQMFVNCQVTSLVQLFCMPNTQRALVLKRNQDLIRAIKHQIKALKMTAEDFFVEITSYVPEHNVGTGKSLAEPSRKMPFLYRRYIHTLWTLILVLILITLWLHSWATVPGKHSTEVHPRRKWSARSAEKYNY